VALDIVDRAGSSRIREMVIVVVQMIFVSVVDD
jgi:hypothetical protein